MTAQNKSPYYPRYPCPLSPLLFDKVPGLFADLSSSTAVVSWNWNGSTPGGQVAEKKTEGEVAVQSKRGNTIKKDAKPDDPAIHLARPGNDVVKNQSELQVDEKNAGGEKEGEKEEDKKETNGTNGTKRKAEEKPEAEGEGKAEPSAKKVKPGRPKAAEKKEKAAPKKVEKAHAPAGADGEKKPRGRPKGQGAGTKKEKKPPAPPTGVGKRTRSQK